MKTILTYVAGFLSCVFIMAWSQNWPLPDSPIELELVITHEHVHTHTHKGIPTEPQSGYTDGHWWYYDDYSYDYADDAKPRAEYDLGVRRRGKIDGKPDPEQELNRVNQVLRELAEMYLL